MNRLGFAMLHRAKKTFERLANHIGKPVDVSKITVASRASLIGNRPEYVLSNIPYAEDEVTAQQSYIHTSESALEVTREFTIDLGGNYFDAHVSADGTKIVTLNHWVFDARYRVVKAGEDYTIGIRYL
jgi:hypothetical protein